MKIQKNQIYYADLNPVQGSEQGGIRPVLIIQNDIGNKASPTVIIAAITSKGKKMHHPFPVGQRQDPLWQFPFCRRNDDLRSFLLQFFQQRCCLFPPVKAVLCRGLDDGCILFQIIWLSMFYVCLPPWFRQHFCPLGQPCFFPFFQKSHLYFLQKRPLPENSFQQMQKYLILYTKYMYFSPFFIDKKTQIF